MNEWLQGLTHLAGLLGVWPLVREGGRWAGAGRPPLWSQGPLGAAGSGWVPYLGLILISEMHGEVQSQPAHPKNPRGYLPPYL